MPCIPHKETGQLCEDCPHYEPLTQRILIVKLGAMGDVLRTTAILPDIVRRHGSPHVTWLTRPESVELLADNPLVPRAVSTADAASLSGAQFDAVYALDNDAEGLGYAGSVRTNTYYGYVAGTFGTCTGVAAGGDPTLFEIGVWDDRKRANRRSYLELLAAMVGLECSGARPYVSVPPAEYAAASAELAALPRPLIGINADTSARWERKVWNFEYVCDLVDRATRDGAGVVLFGGADVYERNETLALRHPRRAHAFASAGNALRLAAGIAQCDVLLTGDTLAMHIAWALNVPVLALFGPTSLAEIDLGPADRKLADDELECLACYLKTCTVDPHCMDRLTPDLVYRNLNEMLHVALHPR